MIILCNPKYKPNIKAGLYQLGFGPKLLTKDLLGFSIIFEAVFSPVFDFNLIKGNPKLVLGTYDLQCEMF